MSMFAFNNAVLLRGVRTRHTMGYARTLKIAMQLMVLTAPIRLDGFNLSVQKTLNMSLKSIENLLNIRFVLEKINPTKTGVVVNKTNIVLIPPGRGNSRAPNIGMN